MREDRIETKGRITLGAIVLWYPSIASEEAAPAIVCRVNSNSLCLSVHDWLHKDHILRETVKHKNDPEAKKPAFADNGCWDYTEEWRDKEKMKQRIDEVNLFAREVATSN